MFVPLLAMTYNSWIKQGTIPQRRTKGIVKLLRKDKHGGVGNSNYRPLTMLNTDFNIFAKKLADLLQTALLSLIYSEQSCAMKGRTIQDSLHMVRTIKVDGNATLSNLDQFKAFDSVNYGFLEAVVCNRFWALLTQLGPSLEPFPHGLTLPGYLGGARYTAYADNVSVLVTSSAEMAEVSKEIERYEVVKIDCKNSVGLQLGSWRGCALPGPFSWKDGPCKILGV